MKHEFQSYYLDSPLICGRVFDLFLPETATQDTALFFVHGGGWNAGSRTGFHQIMEKYNELGYICASTDYRLPGPVRFSDSPGVTAFDQLQDIRESYDRFVSLLKTMGRPLKIAVFCTSAGAHLASLLLCAAPGECGEHCELRNEWVKPSCGFLQSTPVVFEPWQDIFPHIWHAMQFFAAGCMYETDPKRFQALSLRSYIRRDNPPLLFLEAENEHMFPSSMTLELVREHNSLGIPSQWKVYKNAEHGFFYSLERPVQREVFDDIQRFIAGKSVN